MDAKAYFEAHPPTPDAIAERLVQQARLAEAIQAEDPSIPDISAIVIAGDRITAENADAMLAAGVPFDEALVHVGSYAKLDWAMRVQEAGATTLDHLLDLLPDLWPMSDPDDTDPRFLALWVHAWRRNGRRTILDRPGATLPAGRISGPSGRKYYLVYRGQDDGANVGIAWSLDKSVAEKFAHGAGLRVAGRPSPVLYEARVHYRAIMAYLTGRSESECIINPKDLR